MWTGLYNTVAGGVNASEKIVAYVEPQKKGFDMSKDELLMALEPNQGHLQALSNESSK